MTHAFKSLPDMPLLGSSSSAANKDMMAKIWTNGDTVICLGRKIVGKGEIARTSSFSFSHNVFKSSLLGGSLTMGGIFNGQSSKMFELE